MVVCCLFILVGRLPQLAGYPVAERGGGEHLHIRAEAFELHDEVSVRAPFEPEGHVRRRDRLPADRDARRGALGPDDYVVTNVPPITSSYVMNEVKYGKLRDRAVNTATVSGAFGDIPLIAEKIDDIRTKDSKIILLEIHKYFKRKR